jgi:hypothetical protein
MNTEKGAQSAAAAVAAAAASVVESVSFIFHFAYPGHSYPCYRQVISHQLDSSHTFLEMTEYELPEAPSCITWVGSNILLGELLCN